MVVLLLYSLFFSGILRVSPLNATNVSYWLLTISTNYELIVSPYFHTHYNKIPPVAKLTEPMIYPDSFATHASKTFGQLLPSGVADVQVLLQKLSCLQMDGVS